MRRRRRRDYTPEQETARKELHRAEMWSQVVANGIAEAFKLERYCGDGMRTVVDFVNTELVAAIESLESAQTKHDVAFGRVRTPQAKAIILGKRKKKAAKK